MTAAARARPTTVGVVLAAGAGTRFGMPKALARTPSGRPWVAAAAALLADAGCDTTLVVTGAQADAVARVLPAGAVQVTAQDWATGVAASVRAGLTAAARVPSVGRVVLVPVDTPGLTAAAVERVLAVAGDSPTALARATYGGRPGHPVVIGSAHLEAVAAFVAGDEGARGYLDAHRAARVECGDVARGADVDTPEDWAAFGGPADGGQD